MNDRVAALVKGVQVYDHVFVFRLVGDALHVKYMGKPYAVEEGVSERDIVELAKSWLGKWCKRRKVKNVRIFEPHNAAEVGEE